MNNSIKVSCFAAILSLIVMTCGCLFPGLLPEEPWSKYADVAEKYYDQQQFGTAEDNYRRSAEEIGRDGTPSGWVGYFLAMSCARQGKYALAVDALEKSVGPLKEPEEMAESEITGAAENCCYLADIHLEWGKCGDALTFLEKALKYRAKGREDLKKYAEANKAYFKVEVPDGADLVVYPYFGNYYIHQGDYEKARQYLQEVLDLYLRRNQIRADSSGRAQTQLAMANYYAGNDAAAEKLLRESAGQNASAMVVFPTDLALSLTMLGRIAEHRGQHDQALKYYKSARKALHSYRTLVYKVEESDICNQIGRFYVKQGQPEEATKAYHEAIALRRATATQTHPNCADAIKGLADVAASKNELTSATLQAKEALKILDTALVPTHPRIAPTLVALASLDALAGRPEEAAPLNTRLETILQKPLGPWKEDFLETTAFYAGLLKKAGKSAEAGKLEEIAAGAHQFSGK